MAQMLTGSVVRLLITVGTLAAIYFFIVKPILDTTDEAFNSFDSVDKAFDSAGIQDQINQAFEDANADNIHVPRQGIKDARKMLACVEKADNDTAKLQACATQ